MISKPSEVATDHLGVDHVDDYDTELVLAGMREFHDLLSDTARALEYALRFLYPEDRLPVADTLTDIEEALAVLEDRS